MLQLWSHITNVFCMHTSFYIATSKKSNTSRRDIGYFIAWLKDPSGLSEARTSHHFSSILYTKPHTHTYTRTHKHMIYQRCENVGNVTYNNTKLILAYLIKLYWDIALFSVSYSTSSHYFIESLINVGRVKGMVGMYMVCGCLKICIYLICLHTNLL